MSFHGRDPLRLAKSVEAGLLRKGIVIKGSPALLTIELGSEEVHCTLEIDSAQDDNAISPAELKGMVGGMLGLHLKAYAFETMVVDDPMLGTLVAKQRGLRIRQTATAFEALT